VAAAPRGGARAGGRGVPPPRGERFRDVARPLIAADHGADAAAPHGNGGF
jgi:hypothetical protein